MLTAGWADYVQLADSPYRRRFAPLISAGVRLGCLICVDTDGHLEQTPPHTWEMVEHITAKQLFMEVSRQDKPSETVEDILMHLLDGGFSAAAHFQLQASGTYPADFHPRAFALIDLETYHNAYMGKRHLKEERIHCAILCSPHNPCGRVWERWELEKAMDLFRKYDVYVISDEIWSDLTLEGYRHIPTQSISEDAKTRTAALYAPSKTFNLAGLVGSYCVIYNPWLRHRFEKEQELSHFNEMNVLSMHALIGAYKPEGSQWLDELRQVLTRNVDFACGFIAEHFPGVTLQKPQGTYMLFADCTGWCEAHGVTLDTLLKRCWDVGVAIHDGRPFHGANCVRMNLALPLARVQEAFRRMQEYVFV